MSLVIERKNTVATNTDLWADGEHGRFWGACGAAGLLLENQHAEVLLQLRAPWCHHGGTWSIPGGARLTGETPLEAALREAGEEHGLSAEYVQIRDSHTLDYGYWSYVTMLGSLRQPWTPRLVTSEADRVCWVPVDAVPRLRLHPDFAASWPQLHRLLSATPEG